MSSRSRRAIRTVVTTDEKWTPPHRTPARCLRSASSLTIASTDSPGAPPRLPDLRAPSPQASSQPERPVPWRPPWASTSRNAASEAHCFGRACRHGSGALCRSAHPRHREREARARTWCTPRCEDLFADALAGGEPRQRGGCHRRLTGLPARDHHPGGRPQAPRPRSCRSSSIRSCPFPWKRPWWTTRRCASAGTDVSLMAAAVQETVVQDVLEALRRLEIQPRELAVGAAALDGLAPFLAQPLRRSLVAAASRHGERVMSASCATARASLARTLDDGVSTLSARPASLPQRAVSRPS